MFYQVRYHLYTDADEIDYSATATRKNAFRLIQDIINDNQGEIIFIVKTYPKLSDRLSMLLKNHCKVVERNSKTGYTICFNNVKI